MILKVVKHKFEEHLSTAASVKCYLISVAKVFSFLVFNGISLTSWGEGAS